MPKTRLGRYSGMSLLGFVLFFIVFQALVMSGQQGGETFFSNLWLTIPFLLGVILAIAGLIFGCISIIRDQERSVLVYVATVIGFFVLVFVIAEIVFPH